MDTEEIKAVLKEKLDAIEPYPGFTFGEIREWEGENRLEIMLQFMNENPDCDDQDIIRKDLALDGIFPDENGHYKEMEYTDEDYDEDNEE